MAIIKDKEVWEKIVRSLGERIKDKYDLDRYPYFETEDTFLIKDVGGIRIINDMLYFYLYDKRTHDLVLVKKYEKFWDGNIIWFLGLALAWYVQVGEIIYSAQKVNEDTYDIS